jgi:ABC-type multidrug transport system permease subunit
MRRPSPLIELTRARWLEFIRDPGTIFWVFGFPVLLAVALGIAFRNKPPETSRIAVVGPDAAHVRGLLSGADGLEVDGHDEAKAFEDLRSGRVDLVVETGPVLAYHFDRTRPNGPLVRLLVDDVLQRKLGRANAAEVREVQVTEPGGRYIDFLLPGLIGLNIMGSALWGLGYTVVDSRRRKLLKRFAATPMRRSHFLLSYVLSRFGFLVVEVAFVLTFGLLAFDIRVHGSVLAVCTVALLGMAAFSGLALLIASRTDSSEVASGWINFVSMPMWILSGSFFDHSRFPDAVQPLLRVLPLTAINDGFRAVMNHGDTLAQCWVEVTILATWSVVTYLLALRFFKWQ